MAGHPVASIQGGKKKRGNDSQLWSSEKELSIMTATGCTYVLEVFCCVVFLFSFGRRCWYCKTKAVSVAVTSVFLAIVFKARVGFCRAALILSHSLANLIRLFVCCFMNFCFSDSTLQLPIASVFYFKICASSVNSQLLQITPCAWLWHLGDVHSC